MKTRSEKSDRSLGHKQQHQIRNVKRMMKNIVIFVVLQTNTRSLTSSDKIEEMIHEIKDCRWDALLLSETWRSRKAEIWESHPGHIFMGGRKLENNKQGFAIFLNKKWRKRINWTEHIKTISYGESRKEQARFHEELVQRERVRRDTQIRRIREVGQLKRVQEMRMDEFSRNGKRKRHATTQELTTSTGVAGKE